MCSYVVIGTVLYKNPIVHVFQHLKVHFADLNNTLI